MGAVSFTGVPSVRLLAEHADEVSSTEANLAELWGELVSGYWQVVATANDERHSYLLITRRERAPIHGRCGPRNLAIAERILAGESQKEVALDLGVSPSTVAAGASRAVRYFGVNCRFTRLPLPLILALHSSRGYGPPLDARSRVITWEGSPCQLIWVRRPEARLERRLTRGELEVVQLLIDGFSHAEIAQVRRTSRRTVANQLANTYGKLGVSGRIPLVSYLIANPSDFSKRRSVRLGSRHNAFRALGQP